MRTGKIRLQDDRLLICGDRFVELTEIVERSAEVAMGFRIIGFDLDGLAIRGNRLVEIALIAERNAEIGMGFRIIGFDPDGLAIRCNCLVELALTRSALPRLEWASA